SAISDEADDTLVTDAIRRPTDGSHVRVVKTVLVRRVGTRGEGVSDASIQCWVLDVGIVVVARCLADRVRRVAHNHTDVELLLILGARIIGREYHLVTEVVVLSELE